MIGPRKLVLSEADPGQQDLLLWLQYANTHGLQKSCGEKRAAWPLSKLERGLLTPAWTGFYCFSGHITSRMVLIYYAQVRFRWLPFKENKGEDVANYIRKKMIFAIAKGKVVELIILHTWEVQHRL